MAVQRCTVVLDFLKVIEPDVMVIMPQRLYSDYAEDVKAGGTIILHPDMIPRKKELKNVKVFQVPATKIAEELRSRIVANIVMLSAFTAITGIMDKNALRESIMENIPKGTEELNMTAFEKGYEYGRRLLKS